MTARFIFIFCAFFFIGCDEEDLIRQFKEARITKSWIADSGAIEIVSKSYNRAVYLESSGSNREIFNAAKMPGGDKWTWALVDQARISEKQEYLFLPIQYCSQLRFNDKQSYYIKVYNIPSGKEKREILLSPEVWQELGLPKCHYTSLTKGESLPEAIATISPDLLKNSNIIFYGKFISGRSPCEFLPDGSRQWFQSTGFNIAQVHRGVVKSKYIEVHLDSFFTEPKVELQEGMSYFVLLNVQPETKKRLHTDDYLSFYEAIVDEEVIAIISDKREVIYEK